MHYIYKYILIGFLSELYLTASVDALAQYEPLSSQYMNNHLLINPAYTGMHNALATTLSSRQQWMGIEGAPKSYSLAIHSPLNKSYTSLGGTLQRYETGPEQTNYANFSYSHLIKFKAPVMLSLGLSAGITHSTIGLNNLGVIDHDDPFFSNNLENKLSPNFGFGAFLYTPTLYVGFSIPKLLEPSLKDEEKVNTLFKAQRTYYLSGGYSHKIDREWTVKPSFLLRYAAQNPISADINGQVRYKNRYWFGVSYRINQSVAALFNLQLNKSFGFCYSYDMAINLNTYYKKGSHEFSMTYDIFKYYRRTRHRRFSKKKAETPESMKSMRFF